MRRFLVSWLPYCPRYDGGGIRLKECESYRMTTVQSRRGYGLNG
jgi:hypothetical protein